MLLILLNFVVLTCQASTWILRLASSMLSVGNYQLQPTGGTYNSPSGRSSTISSILEATYYYLWDSVGQGPSRGRFGRNGRYDSPQSRGDMPWPWRTRIIPLATGPSLESTVYCFGCLVIGSLDLYRHPTVISLYFPASGGLNWPLKLMF